MITEHERQSTNTTRTENERKRGTPSTVRSTWLAEKSRCYLSRRQLLPLCHYYRFSYYIFPSLAFNTHVCSIRGMAMGWVPQWYMFRLLFLFFTSCCCVVGRTEQAAWRVGSYNNRYPRCKIVEIHSGASCMEYGAYQLFWKY